MLAARGIFVVLRRISSLGHKDSGSGEHAPGWAGFCSRSTRTLEYTGSVVVAHELSRSVARGILVPQPGMKPVSPALQGRFLTTGPPGKPPTNLFHISLPLHMLFLGQRCPSLYPSPGKFRPVPLSPVEMSLALICLPVSKVRGPAFVFPWYFTLSLWQPPASLAYSFRRSSRGKQSFIPLWIHRALQMYLGFPDRSVGKESSCNAGDLGSIPGLGRSPGEGKHCPFQYSGLENSRDSIGHGLATSRTWLSNFHFTLQTYLEKKIATHSNILA